MTVTRSYEEAENYMSPKEFAIKAKKKLDLPEFLPMPRVFLLVTAVIMIIIALYLLLMYDKISSSIQEASVAAVFFVALPTIYISVVYRSLKRQMILLHEMSPKLKMLGMDFGYARSSMSLVLDGRFDDLKVQFSPFSLGKDKFDFYMITFFHQNPPASNILCTNTGYLIGKNALAISFKKHFGLKKAAFPGIYDGEIKCWTDNADSNQSFFHDDKLKFTILKLSELLKHQSACFVLDNQCLQLAFPIDITPEGAVLDAAKELCHYFKGAEPAHKFEVNDTSAKNVLSRTQVYQDQK